MAVDLPEPVQNPAAKDDRPPATTACSSFDVRSGRSQNNLLELYIRETARPADLARKLLRLVACAAKSAVISSSNCSALCHNCSASCSVVTDSGVTRAEDDGTSGSADACGGTGRPSIVSGRRLGGCARRHFFFCCRRCRAG